MKLYVEISGKKYSLENPALDIGIPLIFNGPQPNTYNIPPATAQAFEGGGFVGDVRRGGSCNFETSTLTTHCNGTHTECVGHITDSRISVHDRLQDTLVGATLLSVFPEKASKTRDTYLPPLNPEDMLITRNCLAEVLAHSTKNFLEALIIRTLPNTADKKSRDYMQKSPPFFSKEAMQMIRSYGVNHLLVDMPSVDRLFDEGLLTAHHIFWEMNPEGHEENTAAGYFRTITEMIYVPDEIPDGLYLLNLQIAPFMSDASPSRPRLFRIVPEE
ncbi:MAG: cyclase family protein [Bacteroidia bacterium]|nr:cyclase family protein [Bacteroidia bacterium]